MGITNNIKIMDRENINFLHRQVKNTPRIACVGMYSGCDYVLSLKILFVCFLALIAIPISSFNFIQLFLHLLYLIRLNIIICTLERIITQEEKERLLGETVTATFLPDDLYPHLRC